MPKVLFCGLQHHYGRVEAGPSFEYSNLYQAMAGLPGFAVEFFPIDTHVAAVGRESANALLLRRAEEFAPDVIFFVLYQDEILPETVSVLTKQTRTLSWFCDDHWRFPIFSKYWAPYFSAVATTDSLAVERYHELGIGTVIKTQWAANIDTYAPASRDSYSPPVVSFVGERYGLRPKYMGALLHAGVPTYARGSGWPHGRINQEDMVMCFSDDGIHLNFSESPYYNAYKAARLFLRLALVPDGRAAAWRRPSFKDAWQASLGALRPQIKGRTFEIPACGGMLMTNYADNLSDYFVPGKEIVVFDGVEDLVDKCQHYLSSPKERRAIAQAGLARVRAEHTYQQRFMQIFKELQLPL